jgi:DNA invertase Pin-like site-specific DNA recombinase
MYKVHEAHNVPNSDTRLVPFSDTSHTGEVAMALVGYARVSSVGQTLAVQLDKLKECDKIFQEKVSGVTDKRPQLQACLEYVRQGDTLVVTKLDRLARSTLHLCQIAEELERKQVALQVLDQNIDTNSATGRLLFNMLGAIAQFETEIRAERQREGIHKAKERGVKFGKQRILNREQVAELQKLRRQGALIKTLMHEYGISKTSVYRYLAEDVNKGSAKQSGTSDG